MTRDTDERGKLADQLESAYDKVKMYPENSDTGFMDLLALRNLVPQALAALRAPAGHAEREALIERGAKALCKRFNPGRSLDEYLAPGAELWMRFKTEAEIVIDAALSNVPAPSEGVREALDARALAAEARLAELTAAAKEVCWYDWSENDYDAVVKIAHLRRLVKEP